MKATLLAVHCYGNKRDITSHPTEQHHQLAVEIEGADHCIDIADIPLRISSRMDEGPEINLSEVDTLAIGDEIGRRCTLYPELVAAIKKLTDAVARCDGAQHRDDVASAWAGLLEDATQARAALAKAKGTP